MRRVLGECEACVDGEGVRGSMRDVLTCAALFPGSLY